MRKVHLSDHSRNYHHNGLFQMITFSEQGFPHKQYPIFPSNVKLSYFPVRRLGHWMWWCDLQHLQRCQLSIVLIGHSDSASPFHWSDSFYLSFYWRQWYQEIYFSPTLHSSLQRLFRLYRTNLTFSSRYFIILEHLSASRPSVLVPRFARCPSVTFCD